MTDRTGDVGDPGSEINERIRKQAKERRRKDPRIGERIPWTKPPEPEREPAG